MQGIHKSRQSSEVKRKELLAKLALIRTEAENIGAGISLLENIDKVEEDITSARVNVRTYRDFLKKENNKVESVKDLLHAFKENRHKRAVNQTITSISLLFIPAIPSIFLSKFYYLAHIPKYIPVSSSLIYVGIGDILFYTWVVIYAFYAIAGIYIWKNYILPLIERYPSHKILIRLASFSIFMCLYSQFLYYSASIIPSLISPSWGPSVTNILNLIITFLTSSPINAVIGIISIWPIVGIIIKKYKNYWLFHFRKIS